MRFSARRLIAHRSSLPRVIVVSVVAPPHIARMVSVPGKAAIPQGHIFRAVLPSSSHPPRLIVSSVPRLTVSIRASKQDGGGAIIGLSSYPRPVSSSPRLAPRVARAGRKASRPPSAGSVSGPRFPRSRSGARHRRRLDPAVITASKQARTARPPFRPSCRLRGSPSARRSIDGKGKQNAPLPLSRNGAESIRFIARGNCNRRFPSYRRRYRWPVPAPGDSSRRR